MPLVGAFQSGVHAKGVIWSVNLLWMKGFIALHDFRQEYVGMLISYLLPWLTEDVKANYLKRSGLIR